MCSYSLSIVPLTNFDISHVWNNLGGPAVVWCPGNNHLKPSTVFTCPVPPTDIETESPLARVKEEFVDSSSFIIDAIALTELLVCINMKHICEGDWKCSRMKRATHSLLLFASISSTHKASVSTVQLAGEKMRVQVLPKCWHPKFMAEVAGPKVGINAWNLAESCRNGEKGTQCFA